MKFSLLCGPALPQHHRQAEMFSVEICFVKVGYVWLVPDVFTAAAGRTQRSNFVADGLIVR